MKVDLIWGMAHAKRIAAALLLVLLSGCLGGRISHGSYVLEPSSRPFLEDIPLPLGFRLVDQSREEWSSRAVRYVRHRYVGRGDRESAREFYRRQMPLVRWSAISERDVHGQCWMRFERETESCTVRIEDHTAWWSRGVSVEVVISPKDS